MSVLYKALEKSRSERAGQGRGGPAREIDPTPRPIGTEHDHDITQMPRTLIIRKWQRRLTRFTAFVLVPIILLGGYHLYDEANRPTGVPPWHERLLALVTGDRGVVAAGRQQAEGLIGNTATVIDRVVGGYGDLPDPEVETARNPSRAAPASGGVSPDTLDSVLSRIRTAARAREQRVGSALAPGNDEPSAADITPSGLEALPALPQPDPMAVPEALPPSLAGLSGTAPSQASNPSAPSAQVEATTPAAPFPPGLDALALPSGDVLARNIDQRVLSDTLQRILDDPGAAERQLAALGPSSDVAVDHTETVTHLRRRPNVIISAGSSGDASPPDSAPAGSATADLHQQAARALQAGDAARASVRYAEILESRPDDLAALTGFAAAEQRLGRKASAEAAYRQALALEPDNLVAITNLAVLEAEADPSRAIARLTLLRADHPEAAAIPAQIARLRADMGDIEGALGPAREAVRLEPANSFYRYNLAVLQDRAGLHEAAIATYRETLTALQLSGDASISQAAIQARLVHLRSL